MSKSFFVSFLLILNLVVLDSVAVYFFFFRPKTPTVVNTPEPTSKLTAQINDLQIRLDLFESSLSAVSASSTPTLPSVKPALQTKIAYVTVPGSGSLLAGQWTDIPGTEFYFDPSEFPDLTDVYFEANIKLLNGNGTAFVRLFDSTAGIEIWGSEVQTSSQTNMVITSPKITFRSGKHLIKVQAKSLTADTTVYNSGRLKLITKN